MIARTLALAALLIAAPLLEPAAPASQSCFLLFEQGVGEILSNPSTGCATRITPASTFKIPHALAALDAGVISGVDETIKYDGSEQPFEVWRHDQTLASAIRFSAVWYFQRLAQRLGPEREREYLRKFQFGNMDSTSGLTTFWIGGSLQVSPQEELRFLVDLFEDRLPIPKSTQAAVRQLLVQPRGAVVNARGEQPFNAPWPDDLVVRAKTGSATDKSGVEARWLVGQVTRGRRSLVFVSSVIGKDAAPNAAIDLAARALRNARVW